MAHNYELVCKEVDYDIDYLKKVLNNIKEVIRIINKEGWRTERSLKGKLHGVYFIAEEIFGSVGEHLEDNE